MTRIISLTTTNYKRAKHVEIRPDADGNLVVVAGKNGQGKSSVLDSITAALGGINAKTTPRPIRDGEERAEIVLETEDMIVTRTFTAAGSRLTVKSLDGATYGKGQSRLDDMLGKYSLDPVAFTRLTDREQREALLSVVELPFDLAELDAERNDTFAIRTNVNRSAKEIAAQVAGYGDVEPVEEVSVTDLLTSYREVQEMGRQQQDDFAERAAARIAINDFDNQIAELRRRREAALTDCINAQDRINNHAELPDLDAIQQQIAAAEDTNARARQYADFRATVERQKVAENEAKALSKRIEVIDKRKADGLAAAEFPVDGLGFDDNGVTYQGVPFKQASSAEQIRVSMAMAIALNPDLRVIRIADGSLLDADSLALIEAQAREHDFQVWLEVVGDRDGAFIIEDGEIQS
ncbi:AAA family ATPase [Zhihengliuella halotolerans]|uniref:AAA family ATPase n=1 Tax=Zhihengliuella halotolerans TaxID=370736 RepID=UPI000C80E838|nr:AAA family ATPase [Zhihengliuella halotolerans]